MNIPFILVYTLLYFTHFSRSVGSQDPPRKDGLLRIYSMKFCPYAQRPLLVLKAKKIPHEVVNINLFKKPEWYFKIHPEGKVPALVDGSKVIVESLDICDYLDEKYPENPLYPAEPEAKNRDKEAIKLVALVTNAFAKCAYTNETGTPEGWVKLLLPPLQDLEDELAKRGTKFFGGDKPGMVDFMLWPWAERSGCIGIRLGYKLPFRNEDLLLLRQWKKDMSQQPVCQELFISGDIFAKMISYKINGTEPPYDEY
ncbi:unnamed protein product [Phaedon cochleariae]|uniref:Uncharacterized protein n=1 Tax=Phaedon cochleariae TaxID=80249 RepID=A0A9N9X5F5_PHACE|nr:unnamed protein product [Phaedon cochleariae]